MKPEPAVPSPASPTPKLDKNFLCSRVYHDHNHPSCPMDLQPTEHMDTELFAFLFRSLQRSEVGWYLDYCPYFMEAAAEVQKLRLFYWSKISQPAHGRAWVSIQFSCLIDPIIHLPLQAHMHPVCVSSAASLCHALCWDSVDS